MATSSSSQIKLQPGKGLTSYFHFPDNKNVVVYKHTALGLKFVLGMSDEEAEKTLALAFNDASVWIEAEGTTEPRIPAGEMFKQMATSHDMTLLDALKEMIELADEKRPRSAAPVEGEDGLLSLMAKVAPNEDGRKVLDRLKTLIELHGEKCVTRFDECSARPESTDPKTGQKYKGGRDDQGFVYIRKQKAVA